MKKATWSAVRQNDRQAGNAVVEYVVEIEIASIFVSTIFIIKLLFFLLRKAKSFISYVARRCGKPFYVRSVNNILGIIFFSHYFQNQSGI